MPITDAVDSLKRRLDPQTRLVRFSSNPGSPTLYEDICDLIQCYEGLLLAYRSQQESAASETLLLLELMEANKWRALEEAFPDSNRRILVEFGDPPGRVRTFAERVALWSTGPEPVTAASFLNCNIQRWRYVPEPPEEV